MEISHKRREGMADGFVPKGFSRYNRFAWKKKEI
jgi:hypothetical protein